MGSQFSQQLELLLLRLLVASSAPHRPLSYWISDQRTNWINNSCAKPYKASPLPSSPSSSLASNKLSVQSYSQQTSCCCNT